MRAGELDRLKRCAGEDCDNVVVDLTTAALAPVALSDAGPVVTVRRPAPVTTWSGRYDRRAR